LAIEEVTNARAFDRILANSYYSAESIQRAYGLAADVCYLGVDDSLFRNLNFPRENFVIGVGALHWAKGVDLAIDALAQMSPSRPKLVWVCNYEQPSYRRYIERRAQDKQVEVEIRLGINDKILIDLLNRAFAMLYTSRLEPFGFAPLEANLCGTPVVAVAEGGVRETVKDGINGYLVSRNPKHLARALRSLSENPHQAREIGERGPEYVRSHWNIDKAVDRLEEQLQSIIAEHL
jgi:glycosyltransferase involved in cell wall biosynthesis